jgi:hypothetical protein
VSDDNRYLRAELFAATTDRQQPALSDDEPFMRGPAQQKPVHTGPLTIAVQPACRLRGRVIFADTDKPAANARWSEPPIVSPPNRTVDTEGCFVLDQLKPGAFLMHVYAPENSDYLGQVARLEIAPGQREIAHTFALARGVIVTGKAVDEATGKGVAGVTIHYVSSKTPTEYPQPLTFPTQTKADGSFRQVVPPGRGRLIVYGQVVGYQTPLWTGSLDDAAERFVRQIDAAADRRVPEVQFTLSQGLLTAGRALDPDGKPIKGACISVTRLKANSSLPEPDQMADAEGKFTLSGFNPDEQIVVLLRDPSRRLAAQVQLAGGGNGNNPVERDFILCPLGSVTGEVVDEDQKPISGVTVRLRKEMGNLFFVDEVMAADAEGRFTFATLVPGVSYHVGVDAEGITQVVSSRFRAEAGQTHALPALRPLRTNQSISGKIVDPAGKPMAGVKVYGYLRTNAADNQISYQSRTRLTDVEGRFHLSDLPRGQIDISAVVPGIADLSFYLGRIEAGNKDVRLELNTRQP